jgi:hypothetical protein
VIYGARVLVALAITVSAIVGAYTWIGLPDRLERFLLEGDVDVVLSRLSELEAAGSAKCSPRVQAMLESVRQGQRGVTGILSCRLRDGLYRPVAFSIRVVRCRRGLDDTARDYQRFYVRGGMFGKVLPCYNSA